MGPVLKSLIDFMRGVLDVPHVTYRLRYADTGARAADFAERDEALLYLVTIAIVPTSFRAYKLSRVETRRSGEVEMPEEW